MAVPCFQAGKYGNKLLKHSDEIADAARYIARSADDIPIKRIIPLNPSINVTEKGMQHVIDRHTVNEIVEYAGRSKFNKNVDVNKLISLGTQQPMVKQANGNFARTFDTGMEIGFDVTKNTNTSVMTVITKPNGDLVTAFPGAPRGVD